MAGTVRSVVQWGMLIRTAMVGIPLTMMFLIAPSAMIILGYTYVSPGGNVLQKIHPATLLATASVIIFYFTGRSRLMSDVLFKSPALIYFFGSLAALIIYSILFLSVPFLSLIDTFYTSGVFCLLIGALTIRERQILCRWMDVLMAANSFLGIFESVKNWRLVPLTQYSAILGQFIYPHEYRSTAFLGHPLTNSYVTAAYMLSLILSRRIENAFAKYSLLGLHFVALFAFGSRGATVFLLIFAVLYLLISVVSTLGTGKISKDVLIYLGGGIPAVAGLAIIVLSSGFADRLLERFVNDKGSAEARTLGAELFLSFPVGSLILGPPLDLTYQIEKRYGVIAIENFWLNFIITYGILGSLIFFPGLFEYCRRIGKMSTPSSWAVLLFFFLCCTTSASLVSKNYGLVFVSVICLTSLDYRALLSSRSNVPFALDPVANAPPLSLPSPNPVVAAREGLLANRARG